MSGVRRGTAGTSRRQQLRRIRTTLADRVRRPDNADDLVLDPAGAVVAGCDGSSGSEPALRFAAAEARRRRVALFVVIAFAEPVDPDSDEFDTPAEVRRGQARARAQAALGRAVPDPPPHQVVAVAGLPGQVLLTTFPTAGLLVIGARHRHLLGRLTEAESTEHLLLAHGQLPVVVVPAGWPG